MVDAFLLLRDNEPPVLAHRNGDRWSIVDPPNKSSLRRGSIAILLPSNATSFLSAMVNSRSEREALQIARFAIEDEIAESIEDVHLALGARPDTDQQRRIAVISKQRLESYLDAAEAFGLSDAPVYSADDLLPPGDMLIEIDTQIRGRLNGKAFAIERDVGLEMVRGLVKSLDTLQVYGEDLAAALGVKASGRAPSSEANYLAKLAEWGIGANAINLRQGEFAPKRELDLSGLGQWRRAGWLAAGISLMAVLQIAASGYAYESRAEQYQDDARQLALEGWPQFNGNVGATLAAARTRGVNQSRDRMNVLDVSAALYAGLDAVPTAGMRSLRFDSNRNSLSAVLILGSFGDGDALVNAIRAFGFQVEIGEARMLSGELVAELVIQGTAS